jgi:hypothetical protein
LEHDRAIGAGRIASVTTSRRTDADPDVGLTVVVNMPTVVDLPAPFGRATQDLPVATSKSIPSLLRRRPARSC